MHGIYNITLTITHALGTILFACICASRLVFWLTWTGVEELLFIVGGIIIFGLHYFTLWLGYKKSLIHWRVLRVLQALELILIVPQLLFIILVYIMEFLHVPSFGILSTEAAIPVVLADLGVLAIRKISKKIWGQGWGQGDGSLVSSKTREIDHN